jgi:hypothetical protein
MRSLLRAALCTSLFTLPLACSGESKPADSAKEAPKAEESKEAPKKEEAPAATGAAAATGAVAATGAAAATGAEAATGDAGAEAPYDKAKLEALAPIGVEFCDAYIEAYRKCIIFTVPDTDKAAHANELIHEHENWARTKAGAAEVAATALEVGCRSAQAQAAQKTQALNCAWSG